MARQADGERREAPDELRLASGLDEFDRTLIRILQQDGRRPYAQIARELGVAERTVRRRTGELRQGGVIDITTITDPQLLGYRALAVLGLKTDRSRRLASIATDLSEIEAVDYVVLTTGRYDIFVEVLCQDRRALLECVEGEIGAVAGITGVEIHPYLRLHYQHPFFAPGPAPSSDAAGGSDDIAPAPSLDALDKRLILELNRNGRASFRDLARVLVISEALVRLRYRKLVEGRVLRVMALTNPFGLGFETMAWVAITVRPGSDVRAVADALAGQAAVVYVAICAGRFDLFVEIIAQNDAHLLALLVDHVTSLESVADAESWLYLDLHYKRLRPAL